MSRKKIILYSLIGAVAGGILIADNLPGSSSPAPASAAGPNASVTPAANTTQAPPPPASPPTTAEAQRRFLVKRLAELAGRLRLDPTDCPDALALPPAWVEKPKPASPDAARADASPDPAPPQFRLSAVMVSPRGAWAILNDKVVYLNQVIDGYRLAGVTEKAVVLTNGSREVVCTLKTPLDDMPITTPPPPAASSGNLPKKSSPISTQP